MRTFTAIIRKRKKKGAPKFGANYPPVPGGLTAYRRLRVGVPVTWVHKGRQFSMEIQDLRSHYHVKFRVGRIGEGVTA